MDSKKKSVNRSMPRRSGMARITMCSLVGALTCRLSEGFASQLRHDTFASGSQHGSTHASTHGSTYSPLHKQSHSTLVPPLIGFSNEETIHETSRPYDLVLDAFADPNDKRYSASDWLHNMQSLHNSTILSEIKGPVRCITAWSAFVSLLYKCSLCRGWTAFSARMCLGSTPHSLIASSIGLLLVFRTNSAYQKFREGRKTWEQLHNTCRDMTRMISVYERQVGSRRKLRIQRLLAAFPYLLHHHIQPKCLDGAKAKEIQNSPYALLLEEDPSLSAHNDRTSNSANNARNIKKHECWVDKRSLPWSLLPSSVLDKCTRCHNRPLWITDRLSLEVTEVSYSDAFTSRERLELLKHVNKLSECIGRCERIHQTAVPLNYARHALRGLTLWSFTLPFGLVKDLGLLTGPVVAMVSWLMFGVYQIGHTIEDPFQGSLRLTDMCHAIYRDVMYGDKWDAGGLARDSAFCKEGEREGDWDMVGEDEFELRWKKDTIDKSMKGTFPSRKLLAFP